MLAPTKTSKSPSKSISSIDGVTVNGNSITNGKAGSIVPFSLKPKIFPSDCPTNISNNPSPFISDIEGLPFLESIRQIPYLVGKDNCYFIHVTYLPFINTTGELKTKPTQHSVRELRSIGIQPDSIICRSEFEVSEKIKEKISMFCDVDIDAVSSLPTLDSVYEVPIRLEEENLGKLIF